MNKKASLGKERLFVLIFKFYRIILKSNKIMDKIFSLNLQDSYKSYTIF